MRTALSKEPVLLTQNILSCTCTVYQLCELHWCLAVRTSQGGLLRERTRGRQGHRDACVGTWDLGTRDEELEHIKCGTRGCVGRERGDVKYRDSGKSDISHFPHEYVLVKATHTALLSVPPCLFTKRRPPALNKVKRLSWSSCWWNIGAQSRVGWVAVAKSYAENNIPNK